MSKYEQELLRTVNLHGTVRVQELSDLLGISDQTVRRIVKPLAERGEVKKIHGAIVSTATDLDPPFLARMNLNRRAKVAIGRTVADLIEDGESLAIDTGSTSGFVALALQARRRLTVVTNSAFVASTLATVEGNRVFMAGTQLRDHDGAAFDRAAFEVIERMRVDHAILSASMVNPERGFLVYEQCEVDIATAMKASARRCIMAVDHSKFEPVTRRPSLQQPTMSPGDVVVTSQVPAAAFEMLFKALRVDVMISGESQR